MCKLSASQDQKMHNQTPRHPSTRNIYALSEALAYITFDTLLTIWLFMCEIEAYSKSPQNPKFMQSIRAIIFPESVE